MHSRLAPAFIEIEATLQEAQNLYSALDLAKANPDMLTGSWGWITVQGFASAIEKIYVGCERTLDVVAKQVDNAPIVRDAAWHRELPLRMSNPFEPICHAVLSPATLEALDLLRSFRHRARNTYGSILDVQRVLEIAAEATLIPKRVEGDLKELADHLFASKM